MVNKQEQGLIETIVVFELKRSKARINSTIWLIETIVVFEWIRRDK